MTTKSILGLMILLAASVSHAVADQSARSTEAVIMPTNPKARAFHEKLGFSPAVVAGDQIYVANVAVRPQEGETSLEPAFTRAYEAIAGYLSQAGASWDDVVDVTSFHTDIEGQMPALTAVNFRYMKPPYAAWSAVEIKRFLFPGIIAEIKVTAHRRAPR